MKSKIICVGNAAAALNVGYAICSPKSHFTAMRLYSTQLEGTQLGSAAIVAIPTATVAQNCYCTKNTQISHESHILPHNRQRLLAHVPTKQYAQTVFPTFSRDPHNPPSSSSTPPPIPCFYHHTPHNVYTASSDPFNVESFNILTFSPT